MFVDQYTTQGLVFHLSENIKQTIAKHASELLQQPFETAILRRGGFTWMKPELGCTMTKRLMCLHGKISLTPNHAVKHLLGQMPATFGEFLKTLTQDLDMRSSIDLKIESKDDGRGGDALNALYNLHVGSSTRLTKNGSRKNG